MCVRVRLVQERAGVNKREREQACEGNNYTLTAKTHRSVVGIPAKVIKKVDDVTYSIIRKHALRYHELAKSQKETAIDHSGVDRS